MFNRKSCRTGITQIVQCHFSETLPLLCSNVAEIENQHVLQLIVALGSVAESAKQTLSVLTALPNISSLQRLRRTPMPESERAEGLELLRVAVQACRMQIRNRGWFILEHPQGAASWETDGMKNLLQTPGVQVLTLD